MIQPTPIPIETCLTFNDAKRDDKLFNRYWFDYPADWITSNNIEKIIGVRSLFILKNKRILRYTLCLRKYLKSDYKAAYKAVYSKGVQKLYCICVCDNGFELLDMKPWAKRISCFAYSLWDALNRAVGWFVRHALGIFAWGSVSVACGYAINAAVRIYLKHGMNPFQYLNAYGSYDVIGGMIVKLALLAGLCVLFISVGIELNDRGENLFFPYSQKKSYTGSTWENSADRNRPSGSENSERKVTEDNERYFKILTEHVRAYESFINDMRFVAEQGGNDVLRADYTQYVSDVSNLAQLAINHGGQIPAEVFEQMIPVIKRIDAAKKRIEQQAEQIMKAAQNKQDSGFFKGCATKEKLEKRYKALCKTYHPDAESGDEDTFKRMSDEYEMRKRNFT